MNAAEMYIDVAKTDTETSTNWVAESGVLDLFLLLGPTPHQVDQLLSGLEHNCWAVQILYLISCAAAALPAP